VEAVILEPEAHPIGADLRAAGHAEGTGQ
jgi:hypothetical protein